MKNGATVIPLPLFLFKGVQMDAFKIWIEYFEGDGYYFCETSEGFTIHDKPMLFLHQLQNGYYFITGEELNVNL